MCGDGVQEGGWEFVLAEGGTAICEWRQVGRGQREETERRWKEVVRSCPQASPRLRAWASEAV